MSENGDWDSDDCVIVDEDITCDWIPPNNRFQRRKEPSTFSNTMMCYVPEEMQPYVQNLIKETGNINHLIYCSNYTF